MAQLESEQKIIEFLNEEFLKIKAKNLQQHANKTLKPKAIKKKIEKLLKDIELILKTSSWHHNFELKVIELQKEIENYLL